VLPFEEGRLLVKYLGAPLVSSRLIFKGCKELNEKGWRKVLQLRSVIRDFIWFRIGDEITVSACFRVDAAEDFKEYTLRDYYCWLKTYCCCFGVDAAEDFKEYTLRDYYCWLKTYCCWYKLMLLDKAADLRLRLPEQSVAVDDKMKK
nr:reverse transcriptase domain, reverse transcriptase zinc-binding domain protein [Tanacetum cinerariifolium]